MAIKATHMATGAEIDLDRADEPAMAELIKEFYQQTTNGDRPRDGRKVLECREHDVPGEPPHRGAWVYLRRDRFVGGSSRTLTARSPAMPLAE